MAKHKKEPREKKLNKYDNLSKPQAELDFHDRGVLTPHDVQRLAREFLDDCRDRKLTKVLFITGKGIHSQNGMPVIKPLLYAYLKKQSCVVRVYEGRFDRGGSGTLEAVLDFMV